MAVGQLYLFDTEILERHLAQMKFRQILSFAASCAGRMAPVVELWSDQVLDIVHKTISDCWDISTGQSTLLNLEQYVEQLELVHQEVAIVMGCDFKPELPFVQDAIVNTIYMLQYANSQETTIAISCAQHTYETVDQLAYKMALVSGHTEVSENDLLVSEAVQTELQQQRFALDLLAATSPEAIPVERLRLEARQTGLLFLQRLIRYCELESAMLKGGIPSQD